MLAGRPSPHDAERPSETVPRPLMKHAIDIVSERLADRFQLIALECPALMAGSRVDGGPGGMMGERVGRAPVICDSGAGGDPGHCEKPLHHGVLTACRWSVCGPSPSTFVRQMVLG